MRELDCQSETANTKQAADRQGSAIGSREKDLSDMTCYRLTASVTMVFSFDTQFGEPNRNSLVARKKYLCRVSRKLALRSHD